MRSKSTASDSLQVSAPAPDGSRTTQSSATAAKRMIADHTPVRGLRRADNVRIIDLVIRRCVVALVLVLLVTTPAAAQDGLVATTLDNGLRVVLQEDRRSPIV